MKWEIKIKSNTGYIVKKKIEETSNFTVSLETILLYKITI